MNKFHDPNAYKGDEEYCIDATGDCCKGDDVRFLRGKYTRAYSRYKSNHTKPDYYELVTGKILKDSYGAAKQQHSFTIELQDGTKTVIRGRNLYRNGVWRKPWPDEAKRIEALDEKHERGDEAFFNDDWE